MIVLLAVLTAGWVVLSVVGAGDNDRWAPLYWTVLTVGAACFALVLTGVVLYLILSIKTINLNQRQSNFIDSVTHELKSPIASLKLYVQTLSLHELSRDEQTRFFRHMLEDVERLDHLINHLLDAARLDRKSDRDNDIEVELAPLLRRCAAALVMRRRLPSNQVTFDLEACTVRGRQVDLELIFSNLIDNAIKYANEESPRVGLELLPEEDWALVRVTDNGRGIPPRLRKKIFGRFVRLGSELERKQQGTGLGLYIVRTLVSRLRGKVAVLDGPEGKGTTFEVRLPLVRSVSQPAPPRPEGAEQTETSKEVVNLS
jgi:signal transduction histidine kinase